MAEAAVAAIAEYFVGPMAVSAYAETIAALATITTGVALVGAIEYTREQQRSASSPDAA
jgi:hypothetical protein